MILLQLITVLKNFRNLNNLVYIQLLKVSIEKDDGKKEIPSPRRNKSQQKEENEDSCRTVTLINNKEWPLAIIKQVLVRLYPL